MATQSAPTLLSESRRGDGKLDVEVVLSCGCRVALVVHPERMVELADGRRIAGGKYPCPNGHPVTR